MANLGPSRPRQTFYNVFLVDRASHESSDGSVGLLSRGRVGALNWSGAESGLAGVIKSFVSPILSECLYFVRAVWSYHGQSWTF